MHFQHCFLIYFHTFTSFFIITFVIINKCYALICKIFYTILYFIIVSHITFEFQTFYHNFTWLRIYAFHFYHDPQLHTIYFFPFRIKRGCWSEYISRPYFMPNHVIFSHFLISSSLHFLILLNQQVLSLYYGFLHSGFH